MRTLVLALGNELAADDAVGPLVGRAVRARLASAADVVDSSASGMALLDVFAGYENAVVVDSIHTGRDVPGTITDFTLATLGHVRAPSLHHTGLPEMAAVAGCLGLSFPSRTRVFAVEVLDPYTIGGAMSAAVASAVPELARRVCAQVEAWGLRSGPSPPRPLASRAAEWRGQRAGGQSAGRRRVIEAWAAG